MGTQPKPFPLTPAESRQSLWRPEYLWLIAIVLFFFLAGAVVAAFRGPADASHISAYLATLGGLMGAIFTVGGLVIALAAVLTLLMLLSCAVDQELDQEASLVRLNQLLGRPESVTLAAFVRSVAAAPLNGIYWLAIARGEHWQLQPERPRSPLQLFIRVDDDSGNRLARAGWNLFPSQSRSEMPAGPQGFVPTEKLYAELSKLFLLVCPSEPIA